MTMVIGVHGKAGVGKDTFADVLVRRHNMVKRGFAVPLYEEVAAAFNVPVEMLQRRSTKETLDYTFALLQASDNEFISRMMQEGHDAYAPRSPRQVLQLWGTDYRRHANPRYWIEKMEAFIAENKAAGRGVVAPDTRFENEALCIRNQPVGCVVHIVRDVQAVAPHVSELPLPDHLIDFRVFNRSGDIDSLREAAEYLPMWMAATGKSARNGAEPTVWRC